MYLMQRPGGLPTQHRAALGPTLGMSSTSGAAEPKQLSQHNAELEFRSFFVHH